MLARRKLPEEYKAWNRKWGAPFGVRGGLTRILRRSRLGIKHAGPFAWQKNNSTRVFEYPWAYFEINRIGRALNIVELGGGLSGLQFVLAREGHQVTNIDPGMKADGVGFELDPAFHQRICSALKAPVRLVSSAIQEAQLPEKSVDVILSISALEHFSERDILALSSEVRRILKPNGLLILTADLFLDVEPFCEQKANLYGRNVNLKKLLDDAVLALVSGTPAELHAFPAFSTNQVLSNLSQFLLGAGYPTLVQCVVARATAA